MDLNPAFAKALRTLRKAHGLTQEDFSMVSSRTYISTLERGLKSPTLEKIDALAEYMEVHPLTLLALTYLYVDSTKSLESQLDIVRAEIEEFMESA